VGRYSESQAETGVGKNLQEENKSQERLMEEQGEPRRALKGINSINIRDNLGEQRKQEERRLGRS
jgi:hypothetical protein